ncbi:radical SAM protein [Schaedlerella arabinosiphila]|uniref:Anaerobic ribonucleoside-triphosphate reductase-activating protein n=1 Tax=Schaedlerella arabinosiphila TaxID=2044587 RepID=A0A9X5H5Q2_9FIRM|nr:4Fe-4S single cluster domain-containing protein [Schaedlerella arabinosiphila]NDO67301.1 radical SAM protein [Schaedlerella arabinosiphila]
MNYLKIDKEDVSNGSGLRVVLWLSGCSHKCKGCQNTQTWDNNSGILFDESAKEELFRELDKDYISGITLSGGDPLFETNLDDVLDLVNEINERYNKAQYIDADKRNKYNILMKNGNKTRLLLPKKTIWIYTGYEWEHIFSNEFHYHPLTTEKISVERWKRQQIVSQSDVLVDGRYIENKRDITIKWRGSTNQNVIDIQRSLNEKKIILWCN